MLKKNCSVAEEFVFGAPDIISVKRCWPSAIVRHEPSVLRGQSFASEILIING